MSFEERNTIVSIFSAILIATYYIWRVSDKLADGRFDGPDGLMIWARMVLWTIGIGIVLTIALTILFAIVFAIATGDGNPKFTTDERDRIFSLRSHQTTMIVGAAGWIGALIALAIGWSAFFALNMVLAGYCIGDLLGNISKVVRYRREAWSG